MSITEKEEFRKLVAVEAMKEIIQDAIKHTQPDMKRFVTVTAKLSVGIADALIAELKGGE